MSDPFDTPGLTGKWWFAPALGLWFALLLGGGFALMPPGLHAALVGGLRLDRISGLFALPLESAGFAIVCAALGMAGFALGWLAARRIAAASTPRAFAPGFDVASTLDWDEGEEEAPAPAARRRRIFSAREELGSDDLTAPTLPDEDVAASSNDASPDSEAAFEAVYSEWVGEDAPRDDDEPLVGGEPAEKPDDADDHSLQAVVHDAEFEEIEDTVDESAALSQDAGTTDQTFDTEQPLGDMSLEALLVRLENALETHQAMVARSESAASDPAPHVDTGIHHQSPASNEALDAVADNDPVIAFLRREANRRMPASPPGEGGGGLDDEGTEPPSASPDKPNDAQAALRSALDRLGRVDRPD